MAHKGLASEWSFWVAILVFLGGLATLFWVGMVYFGPAGEPTCDGRVMTPGDLCHHSNGGSQTYEVAKKDQHHSVWVWGAAAVLPTLVSGSILYEQVGNPFARRRKDRLREESRKKWLGLVREDPNTSERHYKTAETLSLGFTHSVTEMPPLGVEQVQVADELAALGYLGKISDGSYAPIMPAASQFTRHKRV
jgi:hypothetical protein